ncbi:hypothetical protein FISHEDRAFT_57184 [Fistulina hepatica ATCC 64428]|nr:hypothetical protein FISHEDRAFT_57184 [Fistulina hepatica ATCC 64428]
MVSLQANVKRATDALTRATEKDGSQDVKNAVKDLNSAFTSIKSRSPSPKVLSKVAKSLRQALGQLFPRYVTLCLPYVAAMLLHIAHDKIPAGKMVKIELCDAWEDVQDSLLNAVMDFIEDDGPEPTIKVSVAKALYSPICSLFFPTDTSFVTVGPRLLSTAYMLLADTANAHPENQHKLRDATLLGSQEVIDLVENISSSNWEDTSKAVIDRLANSSIAFPQPFDVSNFRVCGNQQQLIGRLVVDNRSFTANVNVEETDGYDTFSASYTTVISIVIPATSSSVVVKFSEPPVLGRTPIDATNGLNMKLQGNILHTPEPRKLSMVDSVEFDFSPGHNKRSTKTKVQEVQRLWEDAPAVDTAQRASPVQISAPSKPAPPDAPELKGEETVEQRDETSKIVVIEENQKNADVIKRKRETPAPGGDKTREDNIHTSPPPKRARQAKDLLDTRLVHVGKRYGKGGRISSPVSEVSNLNETSESNITETRSTAAADKSSTTAKLLTKRPPSFVKARPKPRSVHKKETLFVAKDVDMSDTTLHADGQDNASMTADENGTKPKRADNGDDTDESYVPDTSPPKPKRRNNNKAKSRSARAKVRTKDDDIYEDYEDVPPTAKVTKNKQAHDNNSTRSRVFKSRARAATGKGAGATENLIAATSTKGKKRERPAAETADEEDESKALMLKKRRLGSNDEDIEMFSSEVGDVVGTHSRTKSASKTKFIEKRLNYSRLFTKPPKAPWEVDYARNSDKDTRTHDGKNDDREVNIATPGSVSAIDAIDGPYPCEVVVDDGYVDTVPLPPPATASMSATEPQAKHPSNDVFSDIRISPLAIVHVEDDDAAQPLDDAWPELNTPTALRTAPISKKLRSKALVAASLRPKNSNSISHRYRADMSVEIYQPSPLSGSILRRPPKNADVQSSTALVTHPTPQAVDIKRKPSLEAANAHVSFSSPLVARDVVSAELFRRVSLDANATPMNPNVVSSRSALSATRPVAASAKSATTFTKPVSLSKYLHTAHLEDSLLLALDKVNSTKLDNGVAPVYRETCVDERKPIYRVMSKHPELYDNEDNVEAPSKGGTKEDVMDAIVSVLVCKISHRFNDVSANVRRGCDEILRGAAADFMETHRKSAIHFNLLNGLEDEYANYCRTLTAQFEDLSRANRETSQRLSQILQRHDRHSLATKFPAALFPSAPSLVKKPAMYF